MVQKYQIGDEVHFDNQDGRSGVGIVESISEDSYIGRYSLSVYQWKPGFYDNDRPWLISEPPFRWIVADKRLVPQFIPYDPGQVGDRDDDI